MVREQFGQAHHDGVADGRAVLHLDGVDRADERRAVDRGLLRHLGRACEGDQPHFDVPGHLAQERLGRLLGGHHAGGLDIRHPHAQGDVDCEHDRGLCPGQRHRRRRAGEGQQQQRQRQEHQRRRNVLPPSTARGCANDAQAGKPERRLAASTQQPQVERRQHGQHQHPPQVVRPQEVHQRHLSATSSGFLGCEGCARGTDLGRRFCLATGHVAPMRRRAGRCGAAPDVGAGTGWATRQIVAGSIFSTSPRGRGPPKLRLRRVFTQPRPIAAGDAHAGKGCGATGAAFRGRTLDSYRRPRSESQVR